MSFSVSSTGAASPTAPARAAVTTPVTPVQAVTRDKPAPERQLDASGSNRSGSVGVAALLLQRGGASSIDAATEAPAEPKPNLDALNRVLAHYVAQSTAAARLRS